MIQVFRSAEILLLSQGREAVKDPRGEGDGVSEQGGNGETQTHREQSHPASHPAGDTNKNQAISKQKKQHIPRSPILMTTINLQSRHFHSSLPLIKTERGVSPWPLTRSRRRLSAKAWVCLHGPRSHWQTLWTGSRRGPRTGRARRHSTLMGGGRGGEETNTAVIQQIYLHLNTVCSAQLHDRGRQRQQPAKLLQKYIYIL